MQMRMRQNQALEHADAAGNHLAQHGDMTA
jgi:hypothetical protein